MILFLLALQKLSELNFPLSQSLEAIVPSSNSYLNELNFPLNFTNFFQFLSFTFCNFHIRSLGFSLMENTKQIKQMQRKRGTWFDAIRVSDV